MRRRKPQHFYAFDLIWLDGEDLRDLPLIERKPRLQSLITRAECPYLPYARHIESSGVDLFAAACRMDLEGIVAKCKQGVYRKDGDRTSWIKIKNPTYSQAEGRHDLFQKRAAAAGLCESHGQADRRTVPNFSVRRCAAVWRL